MTNIKVMNENALLKVTGGNNGDTDIENKSRTPLFSVGQSVEVFIMHYFHIHTRHATIVAVTPHYNGFVYTVIYDNGDVKEVYADDIER